MKPYVITANRLPSPDSDITSEEYTRLNRQLQHPVGTFINPLVPALNVRSDV
jgi:hypothetical protein